MLGPRFRSLTSSFAAAWSPRNSEPHPSLDSLPGRKIYVDGAMAPQGWHAR